jgi:HSP20 family protein
MLAKPLTNWLFGRRFPVDFEPAEFFKGMEPWPGWTAEFPKVEMTEDDKGVLVKAELPGMDPKDIEVNVTGETLTIRGERKEEKEEKGKNRYYSEHRYGRFDRTIPLPAEVDADKVDATYKAGVLEIKLVKSGNGKSRKIAIKSA